MCGITGILGHDRRPLDPDVLAAMRDAMAHRGPDDSGLWLSSDGRCGLGHRRLAIVDLSPDAAQPMGNEDGSLQVVFNGEIYNHLDLRRELMARGHRFATHHSDTEALVHGFEEWGEGLFPRLAGMFALALYDARTGVLTLARDRVGVKPLYFCPLPGLFLFASEIKGILAHPAAPREADPAALYHYLSFMTTPAPLTMFAGIYKLPPGHVMRVGPDGSLAASPYWEPLPGRGIAPGSGPAGPAAEEFYVSGVRQRLETAVERRMMSDAPMGVFLSGGVDSTAILALMARRMDRPVDTFSVGFADHTRLNELEHARFAARTFGASHHEVLVDAAAMQGYLEALITTQDEPLADWVCIPLHFVSELCAQHGVKVVQVGEGADEQFCGYPGYLDFLGLHRRWWRPYCALVPGPLRALAGRLARAAAPLAPHRASLLDIGHRAGSGGEPFWSGAAVFWETQKDLLLGRPAGFPRLPGHAALLQAGLLPASWLAPDSARVIRTFAERIDAAAPGADQLTRMIHLEFRLRLPELLLMRVDKVTMASSLEARVPFLDHELVEFSMDIPQAVKIQGGRAKHLLKQAVRGLVPDQVLARPKMGFGAPMKEWLQGDFGRRAEAVVLGSRLLAEAGVRPGTVRRLCAEHRAGTRDNAVYIWTLYNAAAWHEHWIEGHQR